ncbi:MAG: hypothetical protein HYY24_02090 [Verrucomicrobia bacterium]|nr:hypothetical protein [Verrucomicrobiota bacterium]
MSYHCPSCQRVIFSRRLKNCDFCGAEIPAHLRFTPKEIEALNRKMAELAERRKQRDREAGAAEKARRSKDGDGGFDDFGLM